jgi:hypothetical protein
MPPAPTSKPTLRKVGADLRWLLEKSGVNPEAAIVSIGVPNNADKMQMIATLKKEFEAGVMVQYPAMPHAIEIYGVKVLVVCLAEVQTFIAQNYRPPESA